MIYPYVGDFLLNPVPLQLSFNYCSHKCSYCFANLNNPNRSFDVAKFQSQLKNMHGNQSLSSLLMRNKYPVIISNLVDTFATSNYNIAVPAIEMLTQYEIPVALQTRGGRGIDSVLKFLPRSVWYVSIPMLDDTIRKRVEPGAPSIESRFELIHQLKEAGHEVLVGINPTIEDFLPGEDSRKLIDTIAAAGVHGVWVAAMHFNRKQLEVMPERDKANLGTAIIDKGKKNARQLQKDCFDFIDGVKKYSLSKGVWVEGMFDGDENHFFDVFYDVYPHAFPNVEQFINWCHANKKDNEPVYYQEFEDLMLPYFIKGKHNVSPYMRCMSQKFDDEIRSTIGYKQSYRFLLRACWNDDRMKRNMDRYWTFALSVEYDKKKDVMTYNRDAQKNAIYHFNRNEFDDEFFITNE